MDEGARIDNDDKISGHQYSWVKYEGGEEALGSSGLVFDRL